MDQFFNVVLEVLKKVKSSLFTVIIISNVGNVNYGIDAIRSKRDISDGD